MTTDLEQRIRRTGLELYDSTEGQTPSIFEKDYWTGKIIDWCMNDEAFKTEMFRFVDVFPSLGRPEAVAAHLREYFCRPGQNFPQALQWGIRSVSPDSMAARVVAKSIAKNIRKMGRQFIVGTDPKQALRELNKLRRDGFAFTIDLLGEAVVSEKEAEEFARRYLDLLRTLRDEQKHWPTFGATGTDLDWGTSPKVNASIKSSALYSQMDPRAFGESVAAAGNRLRPILRKAMEMGAFVLLDMEHRTLKNLTLALYRSIMEEPEFLGYPYTGIVIQAYLHESEQDLRELIDWGREHSHPMTIRLVKGAYWDAEVVWARQKGWPVPVFTNKHESDANFEKLARMLLESGDAVRLACGSHSIRSIAAVTEIAKELGTPPERVEYQLLYGMAEPVRNSLREAGERVRVYAPVGEMIPGMAYLVRRLLENTSNESFLRQSYSQGVSHDELLRNPLSCVSSNGAPRGGPNRVAHDGRHSFRNEPLLDWTLAETRDRFTQALGEVRSRFPIKAPRVIGGRKEFSGSEIPSTNPNQTSEIVGIARGAAAADAERAIQEGKKAFASWRDTDPEQRAEYLFEAAKAARRRRRELAALEVFEAGKSWDEADADVCEAIDFLEYYGREMIRLARPRRMGNTPGEVSHLFYEPRGVAAVIAPWNFPLAISMGMTSAAIVTGNTVIYKPSSESPITGYAVSELFEEAGLPSGVLNFLPGSGREVGDLLVTHPDVAMIAFTGSKEVGLRILRLAGETPEGAMGVKRVAAEMGGKNAIIVDADADLDEAVVEILKSAFGYQGQKCSACSRLIVLEEIHEKLLERLRNAAESLHLGPSEDPRSSMGAVISASAKTSIENYIEIGKSEGTVVVERRIKDRNGRFVPLTIFRDILPEHRLAQEEIFGPVLSVMKVKDFDEAIEVANGTSYALTGGVFSRSPENIAKAGKSFSVGNLYINRGCTGALVERHPFGGFQMSGVGSKAGGPDYLQQFMVPRNVVENTLRRGFAPVGE